MFDIYSLTHIDRFVNSFFNFFLRNRKYVVNIMRRLRAAQLVEKAYMPRNVVA